MKGSATANLSKILTITLLAATSLAIRRTKRIRDTQALTPQLQQGPYWYSLSLAGITAQAKASVIDFDSTNTDAGIVIYSGNSCFIFPVNQKLVKNLQIFGMGESECAKSKITRLNQKGDLILTIQEDQYLYIPAGQIVGQYFKFVGNVTSAIIDGVDFGVTRAYTSEANGTPKAYLRIYSKASDQAGNYPKNFYILESTSTPKEFDEGKLGTLTLKPTDWVFSKTSTDVAFDKVNQVNFVTPLLKNPSMETQWILGEASGSPKCQYGSVCTKKFEKGPSGGMNMYGGEGRLHFACEDPGAYQGIISHTKVVDFFYTIAPTTGAVKICTPSVISIFEVMKPGQLAKNCQTAASKGVVLGSNEYYSGVNVLGIDKPILAVVSIKTKGKDISMRQVVLKLNNALLPTLDTDTYYYTALKNALWRVKKVFKTGDQLDTAFFLAPLKTEEAVLE